MPNYPDPAHRQFPRVPDFDELEKGDLIGFRRARDQYLRDSWVQLMELRILQKRLQQCYRQEGVNYIQNCRQLGELYLDMVQVYGLKGYKTVSGPANKLPPPPAPRH